MHRTRIRGCFSARHLSHAWVWALAVVWLTAATTGLGACSGHGARSAAAAQGAATQGAAAQGKAKKHKKKDKHAATTLDAAPLAGPVAPPPPIDRTRSPVCARWAEPAAVGSVDKGSLDEISGIAASLRHPGLLWAHNDAGNQPRLYALSPGGEVQVSLKLDKLPRSDWEDVAIGPCSTEVVLAGTPCIYLADTGDNQGDRPMARILRLPEPASLAGRGKHRTVDIGAEALEVFPFTYPDGPQDVEAMAVLEDTRVILLTKRDDGQSRVYRLRLLAGAVPAVAEFLGTLPVHTAHHAMGNGLRVTGADLSLDGRSLLVRTSARVLLYDVAGALALPAQQAAQALAAAQPQQLKGAREAQGEAIAWDPRGGFWQVSEGESAAIVRVECAR